MILQDVVAHAEDFPYYRDSMAHVLLEEHFSSFRSSIGLFFKMDTGGMEWGDVYDAVGTIGAFYQYIFLTYFVFFTYWLFNILIGMVLVDICAR